MSNKDLILKTHNEIWKPAMNLLPEKMRTKKGDVIGLTIGLQESALVYRQQIKGPARGLWQFEKGGGMRGVLTHPMTAGYAKEIQQERGHGVGVNAAFDALDKDDIFAAAMARLLMWSDPFSLPEIDQSQRAWNFYLRTWRPGKPKPDKWTSYHTEVREALA